MVGAGLVGPKGLEGVGVAWSGVLCSMTQGCHEDGGQVGVCS